MQYVNLNKGFILLPVILTLTILASVAYLLSSEGTMNAGNVNREHQQDSALYVAQAGYNHAVWQLNRKNCSAYTDIAATNLGVNSYLANITDTDGTSITSGSPVNINVEGTERNGVSYTFNRYQEKVYQYPTQQVVIQPDGSAGKDTYIYMWKKTWNYGLATSLWVKNDFADSYAYSLLSFDMSSIPSHVKIISATLELWQHSPTSTGGVVSVRRVLNDWTEGTKTNGIGTTSWNERDTGLTWSSPGGDYSVTTDGSSIVPAAAIRWSQWDISQLVADWVSGKQVNYGFTLVPESANTFASFRSSDFSTEVQRPKLTIEYACECGQTCSVEPVIGSCDGTYRDEFNTIDFAGNDGTLNWTNDWQEVNESDGATNGDIRVTNNYQQYELTVRDNDGGGEGLIRQADLSGAGSVTLSLDYLRWGLDNVNDYVTVEISPTGTAPWVERGRFSGSATDSSYSTWSYALESGEITATTAIRLLSSPTMGAVDYVYFDNIELQCSP